MIELSHKNRRKGNNMDQKELEKWFDNWFSKKQQSDYLFPSDKRDWLWLAFLAGAHTSEFIENEK